MLPSVTHNIERDQIHVHSDDQTDNDSNQTSHKPATRIRHFNHHALSNWFRPVRHLNHNALSNRFWLVRHFNNSTLTSWFWLVRHFNHNALTSWFWLVRHFNHNALTSWFWLVRHFNHNALTSWFWLVFFWFHFHFVLISFYCFRTRCTNKVYTYTSYNKSQLSNINQVGHICIFIPSLHFSLSSL